MSCHYWITRWGLEILGKALFGLSTHGRHNIPAQGPVLIASNHRSALDPVIVGTAARREIHYLAKEELFRNRAFARLLQAYNAFPVRRGAADRQAMARVLALLRIGRAVLLFPEGTRNRSLGFLPARPGAGMLAVKAGVPVVPTLVAGTDKVLSQIARRGLRVRFGPPILAPKPSTNVEARKREYRTMASTIMNRIVQLTLEEADTQTLGSTESPNQRSS